MKKENKIQGFKAPEDYFENFEERLFYKIAEENFPESSGFKIPENYFADLENRLLAVVEAPKTKSKVIPLFRTKHIAAVAAVAASLIIGISIFKNPDTNTTIDSLQLATIDNYIDAGNLNLDFYELTSYISDEDISNLDMQHLQLEDAEIEAYLFENTSETILNEP
ncbi:MAG TPA: hypothetical protein VKX40_01005 [Aequorivita sp.]|nr:hypothetical protein [Aequorivita sp.]